MTDVISDMPLDDRPRERLLNHGARTLSDAELIGILIGCGTIGKNAVQLGRELLSDGMAGLAARQPEQIARANGMGTAKAARIAAAFEIARRLSCAKPVDHPLFDTDVIGADLVRVYTRQCQERLGAYFLDSRQHILRQREIFIGTVNSALVSTRDLLRCAVEDNAVSVVLFHNHPSGDPQPSAQDIDFTIKARDSLRLADIELLDHLVIGAHRYLSMKRKGLF